MKYGIIEQETHPDRFVERIIGPFDTWDEANRVADEMEASDSNIIPGYGTRRYYYRPMDMYEPSEA